MPASTGTQGRKETSQRGVMPDHCGRVFVALASWRAAASLKVRRTSGSVVIGFSSKRRRDARLARTTAEPSEGHYWDFVASKVLAADGWLQPSNRRRKHFEVEKSSNIFARRCIAEIYTYIKSVIFGKFVSPRRPLTPRLKPPLHTTSPDKARLERRRDCDSCAGHRRGSPPRPLRPIPRPAPFRR